MIATTSPILWYMTRVSGLLALMVLTLVVVLGIAVAGRLLPAGFARFLGPDLHRRLSLTLVAVVALHVVTALLDSFVHIGWSAVVVPFLSRYRRAFIGFGTLAFDGLLVVVATSLVRHLLGFRVWKRTHSLVWLVLGLAIVHGLGSGSDSRTTVVLGLYGVATLAVVTLGAIRLARDPDLSHAVRIAGTSGLIAVPSLVGLWARVGPLAPGWARKVDGVTTSTTHSSGAVSAIPFGGTLSGSAETVASGSTTDLVVNTTVANTDERLRFDLFGQASNGAFAVERAVVHLGTSTAPTLCAGSVTAIAAQAVTFSLSCPQATVLGTAQLTLLGTSVSGTVSFQRATVGATASGLPQGDDTSGGVDQ